MGAHFLVAGVADSFNGFILPTDLRTFSAGDLAVAKLLTFIVAALFRLAAIEGLTPKRDLFNTPAGIDDER